MTTREQVEAEAEEYVRGTDNGPDGYHGFIAGRTVTEEQIKAGAEGLCEVRYQMHGVKLEHAKRSGSMWRKDIEFLVPHARAVLRASGLLIKGEEL